MSRLKKAVANLLSSPLHAIVGLDLMATGIILLTNRRYFFLATLASMDHFGREQCRGWLDRGSDRIGHDLLGN